MPWGSLSPTCSQQVVEGSISPELDFADSPKEEPHQVESRASGGQRCALWRAALGRRDSRAGVGTRGVEMPILYSREPHSLQAPLPLGTHSPPHTVWSLTPSVETKMSAGESAPGPVVGAVGGALLGNTCS